MSKRAKTTGKLVSALIAAGLLMAVLLLRSGPAIAHIVPSPCDFTTGGGWVVTDAGYKANFGLVGGCKNSGFFGHVNFIDHGTELHMSSTEILGYFDPTPISKRRDICGTAKTNLYGNVYFRARTIDAEQQAPPLAKDRFGIKLIQNGATVYLLSTRPLGGGGPGGGDIELHKPNPSTTGPSSPPDEFTACGGDDSGLGF